jgi:hypothetical protein
MSLFEYVMIPPAIVLGLALAHILGGAGKVVLRLAGHGPPIRVDWVHSLWIAHVFIWIVFFWWYSFSWIDDPRWGFLLFLFVVVYSVWLYLLSVVVVPGDFHGVTDLGRYFLSIRKWFFGGFALLIVIDFWDSAAKGLDNIVDLGEGYFSLRLFLLIGCVIATRTERFAFHGPFALIGLVWTFVFFWLHRPVLSG